MNTNLIKFLVKLKNASFAQKETIAVDFNLSHIELLKILYLEGLIQSFRVERENATKKKSLFIKVTLRYFHNKPILKSLKIFSKPSHLKYIKYSDICKIRDSKFMFFLSTTRGILTSIECKREKMGGKLLFMC
jgi:small subunit ribosomal protein S8